MTTIFSAILRGDIPCDLLYTDADCIAIHDIHPQAPVHILIIPRRTIPSLAEATTDDRALLGHLLWVAHDLAATLEMCSGYRVVINTGADALQSVMHLHLHLLGGRGFAWPPG